ncbi:MAG: nickel-dependent hydrogenase large subunit [Eubacteriales bacterium]
MGKKIRISPVTRINGFWNVEVQVDSGIITDAWSSGIFFRGLEIILKGRDPRDAAYLTERICGICSTAHAVASSHAIEEALKINIPKNAVLLRNLSFGADLLQNHIRHFYLLTIPDFVKGPDRPPFVPRYEGGYRLSGPETDRIMENYRQHFELARMTHEMVTIFGGKAPHQHGIVPGGVTTPPTVDRIQKFMGMLNLVEAFVTDKLIPDLELLARKYEDYYRIGRGYGNLLAYGNFAIPEKPGEFVLPFGVYTGGKIGKFDQAKILEHIHKSWYIQDRPRNPKTGWTKPEPDKVGAYSWVKAPRYDGKPFESGPLSHLWMKGIYRRGTSTMDRLMARALEAKLAAGLMRQWLKELEIGKPIYQPYGFPDREVEGIGYTGAMRGALGHWVRFKGKKITHYQIVTPSAWYCSPRDDNGMRGPIEEALIGTPVADVSNPIEVGRVARAFDPCLACAVHLVKVNGERVGKLILN